MSLIGVFSRRVSVVLLLLFSATSFAEDPNGKNPAIPLAVRPQADVEQLVTAAQALSAGIQKELSTYSESRATGKLVALAPKVIGQTAANTTKLQRLASQLELWGETAGVDYRLRSLRFRGELSDLIRAYRALPTKNETLRKALPTITARAAQLSKDLPTVAKLSSQGKQIDAEGLLNAWADELEVFLCWFDEVDRGNVMKPFQKAREIVLPLAMQMRKDQIAGKLVDLRNQAAPDFMAILAEAKMAADGVRASGKATMGDKSLSGPEAVAALGQKWLAAQVGAAKARALDYARGLTPGTPAMKDYDSLLAAHQPWSAQMPAAITAIIEADASRASANDAPALYGAYLQSLAPLAVAGAGLDLEKGWEPSLAMLAAKSPMLAEDVAAYRRATSEMLRWRKLSAESRARTFAMEYVAAPGVVAPIVKADAAFGGLLTPEQMTTDAARLRWCVPEVVKRAQVPLTGKKVVLADWMPAGGNPAILECRPATRIYGRISLPPQIKEEIDALKRDLQVTATLPPLTLAAAVALQEAERGAALQVGLEVADMALVSLIDRQAALTPAEAPFLTLGALPLENPKLIEASDVYMRLEGTPRWIRFSTFCWEGK